jgi:putative ABC transport system permease protein
MTAVVVGGLRMRKLRAVLTALAVVLGVAMISGTYVLMDTTTHAFNSVYATAYSKADAVVVGKSPISGPSLSAPSVPAALVSRIHALAQVQAAQGFVMDTRAQLRNTHGGAISGTTVVVGAPGAHSPFYATQVVAGQRPTGPGEIAVDEQTANNNHLRVGSTVGLVSLHPLEWLRVVGIVRYGGVGSLGPIRLVALDLPVAQQLFNKQGLYDQIYVSSRPGVSSQQLVRAIAPVLPATAQVRTRAEQVQSRTNDINQSLAIIRYVLLAFGGIALFVGSFVIFNTLSVTVAQRTREFATLRTLGASRRQVLGSVVVEGLVIGVLASLIGLVAGLGLAKGLQSLFAATGTQLPNAGIVFATRTVIVSLAAGIIVTLLASVVPAVRATRVAPIAAVREGAILPPGLLERAGKPLLAAVGIAGAVLLGIGLFASGLSTAARLLLLAGGASLMFVGLTFVSQWVIAPLAVVIGGPFVRVAGATGELARENTSRNPARTAITAGALTVGVAVVAFIAVLGAGLRATTNDSIKQQLTADYVIRTTNGTPLPTAVGDTLRSATGITATAFRYGQIRAFGKTQQINGIDPATVAHFYNFKWTAGSGPRDLSQLDQSGAIISQQFANDHHLSIGSLFRLQTQSGTRLELTVRGIQQLPVIGGLLGPVAISTTLFDRSFVEPGDVGVVVDTAGGASPAAQRSLTKLLGGFPDAKVQTVAAFIKTEQASITFLLNLFYVLLALAIIVSLFGIVNTLVLSIVERTREIGALRAMGMTRRQLKRMIRLESQITALIGAVIGIIVGVVLAALTTAALSTWNLTFTVPVPTLVAMIVIAFFAGRLASRFPARRAAHLDPLQALQYE